MPGINLTNPLLELRHHLIEMSRRLVSEESGIDHEYYLIANKPPRLLEYGDAEEMASVGHFHLVGQYRRYFMHRLTEKLPFQHIDRG